MPHIMITIPQEAARRKRHRIRLDVKRKGVTGIEPEASITFMYSRRALLP